MIHRTQHIDAILKRLAAFEVTAILGPRQIGKTTLAKQVAAAYAKPCRHFDLEDPAVAARLNADPGLALRGLKGLVVIDEVQRAPELFPLLRVLADRRPRPARFLILGSAAPDLLRQSSETLAGRINHYELPGLSLQEVGTGNLSKRWLRGGFPAPYLARSHRAAFAWLQNFTRTFLERDLAQLGFQTPASMLRRFWSMLAHWHGQVWNSAEFARSFGVSDKTVRRYLDILTDTLVVRQLQPWHENIAKRQVKSPKIYLRDTGLLHSLLKIDSLDALDVHPKMGASWEGLMLEQVQQRLGLDDVYFWAAHSGAELDMLAVKGRHRIGIEVKRTTAPRPTPSLQKAIEDLRLSQCLLIHAGPESYPLSDKIQAIAAPRLLEDLEP